MTENEAAKQSESFIVNTTSTKPIEKSVQKKRIYKNLLAVSFSYLFHCSAYNGLSNLQSSLNSHNNLGIYTLLFSSLSFLISCLFVPILLCKLLGFKWSIVLCESFTLIYVVANYFPSFYTLLPAAVAFGTGLGTLWTLQGSFVVHISHEYNGMFLTNPKEKHLEKTMFKFFGIFMIFFQMNQIIGNVISAVVLNKNLNFKNDKQYPNETLLFLRSNWTSSPAVCGSRDCPGPSSEIVRPDDQQVFWLCVCYFVLTLMGIITLLILMDDIRPSKEDFGSIAKSAKDIFKIFLNKKIWTFIPLMAFLAVISTFITVDYSKSYIACSFGIDKIGLSFIIYGLSSSVFSFLSAQLSKLVNKTLILVMALCSAILLMLYLNMNHSYTGVAILYLVPIVFGILEGVWGTVINTMIGTAFIDKQLIAFSNNRFSTSLFFLLAYTYSGVLCVYMKTYIVIGLSILSIFSTLLLERMMRKEAQTKIKLKQTHSIQLNQ